MKELLEKILNYLPAYLSDFVAIFSGPKTFIAAKRLVSKEEWQNALVFLGISMAISCAVNMLLQPSKNLWNEIGGVAFTNLLHLILWCILLRASWWIVED